jgi:lysosomal acid phosphatase
MSVKARFLLALLFSVISLNSSAQAEKLIFAVDVIRHGDRTPIKEIPKDPHTWPQGLGQLTPTGMQQEFHLGQLLRKRYIEEAGLLPNQYQKETIYVRSSDFDRTLMSAESLLLGLYPLSTGPKLPHSEIDALASGYQPIPIHTLPLEQDKLLVADRNMKIYQEWLKKYVYLRPDWKKKSAELEPYFARWSQLTGIKITSLVQLISLGDTLYIRDLYQLPLPKGMTKEETQTIIEARHWAFTTKYKARAFGQATGQDLLKTIAVYVQEASEHKTPLKWVLFSAHDSTILSLMSAMGAPMETPPRYASNLNFSLYETKEREYFIKISLNEKVVTLPACRGSVCKLNQFEALVKS